MKESSSKLTLLEGRVWTVRDSWVALLLFAPEVTIAPCQPPPSPFSHPFEHQQLRSMVSLASLCLAELLSGSLTDELAGRSLTRPLQSVPFLATHDSQSSASSPTQVPS